MGALHRDVLRLLALGGLHFGFLLLLLLPASQASGWMNFHIEDAGLYSGFADHLAERGLLQDSSDLDEYARARMLEHILHLTRAIQLVHVHPNCAQGKNGKETGGGIGRIPNEHRATIACAHACPTKRSSNRCRARSEPRE